MKNEDKIKLFLVDDDPLFLKMLEIEFHDSANFMIETYLTGELCVQNLSLKPHLIILDYHLDGTNKTAMNGLQTLDEIKKFDSEIPVIMLSAQDKIDVAIKCMHHKATDYVVKSETAFFRLKQIISKILHSKKIENQLNWYMDRM
jgi:DNA-binding NarL/FixJ family response regulator